MKKRVDFLKTSTLVASPGRRTLGFAAADPQRRVFQAERSTTEA
jgi:hypothetical protein